MADTNDNAVEQVAKKSGSWFKGLKAEYKKVIWPNKEEVTKQTIAVVVVSFVVGVLIAVLDMGLQYGIDFIINL
ncbi:MAG: preprotein translocase subunit SecE [Lachnospiraceae bacterium]|nr:preprotein translocase subunit SecE [Lachnospiraceae bacterium]MBR5765298.1 preprotein translocase subunit SecE [Lachnospiraceae bacterium]MBR6470131.1 preprotein translocase subunit SecE [Lachnospiraceae bacterium]MBR6486956.1 preprotein translocase subunit SecE [Lachnospiraceae bacterium]